MIYTITLNPSFDNYYFLEDLEWNRKNTSSKYVVKPGGKGINVSNFLNILNTNSTMMGFLGNSNAFEFNKLLDLENINTDFNYVNGLIRTNCKIKTINKELEISGVNLSIKNDDKLTLISKINSKLKKDDTLILSGSHCDNGEDIYEKLAKICNSKKINFIVDASNRSLESTLKYQPLLIKT